MAPHFANFSEAKQVPAVFSNGQHAMIFNTNSQLDGIRVKITGIVEFSALQNVYVIERLDGELFHTGFTSLCLTSYCLKPLV